jgi:hypothetical protein
MSGVLVIALAAVLVLVIGVWAWISRDGGRDEHEMGTISGQWLAEHRSQEHQSDGR